MRDKKFGPALFALLFLLPGCAPTVSDLDAELAKAHGMSEHACLEIFGVPTERKFVDGSLYLTWARRAHESRTDKSFLSEDVDTVRGPVRKGRGKIADVSVPEREIARLRDMAEAEKAPYCILRITIDRDRVTGHHIEGDDKGCDPWTRAIKAKFGTDTFSFGE